MRTVQVVWVIKELTLSFQKYSAEDAISASFCLLYFKPFFKVSDVSHPKDKNKGVLARATNVLYLWLWLATWGQYTNRLRSDYLR